MCTFKNNYSFNKVFPKTIILTMKLLHIHLELVGWPVFILGTKPIYQNWLVYSHVCVITYFDKVNNIATSLR